MIIPRANRTLLEHIWILDETTAPDASSFTFKHAYFMDNMTTDVERQSDLLSDVPKFLHLLRHPVRSLNFIPRAQPKSVHRNRRVKTVRAHFASSCLGREVTFLLNVIFYLSFFPSWKAINVFTCIHFFLSLTILHHFFQPQCHELWVDERRALLAHFRQGCAEGIRHCERYLRPTVYDPVLLRYKGTLVERALGAMDSLGFINSSSRND